MDENSSESVDDTQDPGPDGAEGKGGRPEGVPEGLVERSYFDAEIARERAKRHKQRDEFEARLAALESSGRPEPKPDKGKDKGDPLSAKLTELERRLEEKDQREKRERTTKAVLDKVPEGNRELAQDVLDAMIARGEVDPSAAASAAIAALKKRQPALFVDPNAKGPRPAPQRRPDGSVDWSRYTHASQVPKDLVGQVPPAEWARMRGATGGGAANI